MRASVRERMSRCGRRMAVCLGGLLLLALLGEAGVRLLVPPSAYLIPFDRSPDLFVAQKGREHPWSAGATNALRLAVVGDSSADGVGNLAKDHLAATLEWLCNCNEKVPPAEVCLYARPSASYQQNRLVDEALAGGAQVVILAVNLNDTEDWGRGEELMRLRPDMQERERPWARWPLLGRSALIRLAVERVNLARRMRGYRRYYEFLYREDYSGLRRFREAVPEIAEQCRAKGARLVGVLMPLMNQDLRPGHYPFAAQHAMVREAFDRQDIPFVDLYDAFRFSDATRLQNIPQLDPHPNEIAHRIAAEATLRFLLERGLVDRAYAPRTVRDRHLQAGWYKRLRAVGHPAAPPAPPDKREAEAPGPD